MSSIIIGRINGREDFASRNSLDVLRSLSGSFFHMFANSTRGAAPTMEKQTLIHIYVYIRVYYVCILPKNTLYSPGDFY